MTVSEARGKVWAAAGLVVALVLAPGAQAQSLSWVSNSDKGGGKVVTTQRAVAPFTGVSMELPGKLELVQGTSESVVVEADDTAQAKIETVVDKGQLHIRAVRGSMFNTSRLNVTVNLRSIDSLALAGSGDVHAARLTLPQLKLAIAGSGDAKFDVLEVDALSLAISGSGDITAAGKAAKVDAKLRGSGEMKLGRLASKNLNLAVAGSGNATVWATESLTVSVAGSGDVRYYDGGRVTSSVAGSGSITRVGAAP